MTGWKEGNGVLKRGEGEGGRRGVRRVGEEVHWRRAERRETRRTGRRNEGDQSSERGGPLGQPKGLIHVIRSCAKLQGLLAVTTAVLESPSAALGL